METQENLPNVPSMLFHVNYIKWVFLGSLYPKWIIIYKERAKGKFPVPKGDLLWYGEYSVLDETHWTALWRILVKQYSLNLCKDLAQIKDGDLEKGKKKTSMVFSRAVLCVCISIQCLHVFNAHTQLEGGSTHSVFCSVWVWIRGKHVVPFCFLEHSVKWREKT